MKGAILSEQGMRSSMEDTYFLDLNFQNKGWVFGGVYDGHGGRFASQFAKLYMHHYFIEELNMGLKPEEAFKAAYERMSSEIKNQQSGTTAVNFFIREGIIYCANAGDARAIVIKSDGHIQLSVDHRVENPEERKRIIKMGGVIQYPYVVKGLRGLMPTRAIGDDYFRSVGIISTPSTNRYVIEDDDIMLIAASDGLFDIMENFEVEDLARRFPDPDRFIEELSKEALSHRLATDNITVIALSFKD